MPVVLDTNILASALIASAGIPAAIYNAWERGKFTLVTCVEHLDELRATLQNLESPISSNPIRQVGWSIKVKSSPRTSTGCRT